MISIRFFSLVSLILGLSLTAGIAVAMEASPRGATPVPFTVVRIDSAFTRVLDVESRTVGGQREVVVGFVVQGFSDVFKAGSIAAMQDAWEVSFYSPRWNLPIDDGQPQFVWWESDDVTSTHVFKIAIDSRENEVQFVYDNRHRLVVRLL